MEKKIVFAYGSKLYLTDKENVIRSYKLAHVLLRGTSITRIKTQNRQDTFPYPKLS